MTARSAPLTFLDLFTPKLVTVLRERYRLADLRADVLAGLTVAIVALPLSMAIAIASGVSPDRGITTAIVGGFFVSLLGGSRFQIGGPAGAFIVLVSATIDRYGVDGLILATMLSGMVLLALGFLRLGTYIRYIPFPVVVGFTAGIAVIIFASQIADLFGLTLAGKEPGPLVPKLIALGQALPSLNLAAVGVAALTLGVIVAVRSLRPAWPALLIAVGLATTLAWLFALPVATIGTQFGGIPRSLPAPHIPMLSLDKVAAVLPAALSFALLGAIESLLSAVVADTMSGARHRSNGELVAQGVANVASALFGGICVTGTIARTATNVRSGARGPLAGILHSVFLLLFLLLAAPLASYIPLATLAGVLTIVAWSMVEKHAFATLLRASRGDALVLLSTFLLVVFRDLTTGILVGFGLGTLLFLHRMAQAVETELIPPTLDDREDSFGRVTVGGAHRDVVVIRIAGAFFFGAAAGVMRSLDRVEGRPKAYVIDLSAVPFVDTTAAGVIEAFVQKAMGQGAAVCIAGARRPIRRLLILHGLRPPHVRYRARLADAIDTVEAAASTVRVG